MSVETTVVVAKPVINLRLFTIRIITAVSLFAVLGKANVWLDTATNSILALGYRALLLLLPLTLLVLGRRSLSVTLLCAALGLILLAVTSNQGVVMFAAALFAYGIAIAGYLIKSEAAQTKEGAAYNRVAMNMGSLLALLAYPIVVEPLLRLADQRIGWSIAYSELNPECLPPTLLGSQVAPTAPPACTAPW